VIVSSLTGYALLTSLLMTLAGGRVVVALEGGYNLKSISTSMEAVVRTLLGDPLPRFERTPEGPAFTAVRKPALQAIHDTMQALSQYWPVFLRTLAVIDSQPQLHPLEWLQPSPPVTMRTTKVAMQVEMNPMTTLAAVIPNSVNLHRSARVLMLTVAAYPLCNLISCGCCVEGTTTKIRVPKLVPSSETLAQSLA
jgi:hypothetical protein